MTVFFVVLFSMLMNIGVGLKAEYDCTHKKEIVISGKVYKCEYQGEDDKPEIVEEEISQ